jgi:hypothetical protein
MTYKVNIINSVDYSNKKFNYLTAIKSTDKRMGSNVVWECLCDCGNICYADSGSLKTGNTKSCGCLKVASGKRNIELVNKKSRLPVGYAACNQLFGRYRREALSRGLSFSLTVEKFREITSKNCFYCGVEPLQGHYYQKFMNGSYVYNGIDRLDNNIGYEESNIVTCCWSCNQMKADRTKEQFIEHIRRILLNTDSKRSKG